MDREMELQYEKMGISPAVFAYGEAVLDRLTERFAEVDRVAEHNQAKVIARDAEKPRSTLTCFAATTGYGYDDIGRDRAGAASTRTAFHTEAALVRPADHLRHPCADGGAVGQPAPGRRAALARWASPYDTLEEVIGIRDSVCSLKEYGVSYRQVDLAAGRQLRLRGHPGGHQRKDEAGHHPALQGLSDPADLLRSSRSAS